MALTITEPEGQESYPVYRFLTADGLGGGAFNAIGDYSVTPLVLKMTVRPAELIHCHLFSIHIEDAGQFDPAKYGALAKLTNGVHVGYYGVDGVEKWRITQEEVKDHAEWAHYGISSTAEAASGDMMFVADIDMAGAIADGLKMYPGESIQVHINDNLTGLVDHTFIVHGGRTKQ